MRDLTTKPVPAFIQITCEVPTNSRVVGNTNREIIRNVSNVDIMEFGINVTARFFELDKSPVTNTDNPNSRITQTDIHKLNSARNFNVHGDTAVYLNFTNQSLVVKRGNNYPIHVTPMPDIKTTKQGMIYVIKVITVPNSSFRYSNDIHDYVKQLKLLYSDSSQPEFHDIETKTIVNFLADNQHLLTNVSKSGTDAVSEKDKVYFIQAAVAYVVSEKEINEEDDLSVTTGNGEFMLSRKPLLEVPRIKSSIYASLLYASLHGDTTLDQELYRQHAMLLYYNDLSGVFDRLFVNILGKVKEIVNVRDARKKEGFFTETLIKDGTGISIVPLEDIVARKVKFVFTNRLDAESSADPEKTLEEQKQRHEREMLQLNNEKIKALAESLARETEFKLAKDNLEKDLVKIKHDAAVQQANILEEASIREATYKREAQRRESENNVAKSEFDIAKYKRETTQEYVKNGALIASGLLNLGALVFLAKRT
jgi:hypothetical protein